jgi:hypothetical protein
MFERPMCSNVAAEPLRERVLWLVSAGRVRGDGDGGLRFGSCAVDG